MFGSSEERVYTKEKIANDVEKDIELQKNISPLNFRDYRKKRMNTWLCLLGLYSNAKNEIHL